MTAEPTWPGEGPSRYHPGSWKLVGTWTVPSGFSPSAETATATPMAGIRSATGADRATAGLATPGWAAAADGGAATGTDGEATGPASGFRWLYRATTKIPVAISSRTPD